LTYCAYVTIGKYIFLFVKDYDKSHPENINIVKKERANINIVKKERSIWKFLKICHFLYQILGFTIK